MFFKKKSSLLRKQGAAEFVGTLLLAFAVMLSVQVSLALATPIIAGLTLGLLVYTIGPISGAHVNPAITLGLYSIGAVDSRRTVRYLIAQLAGGILAWLLGHWLLVMPFAQPALFDFSWQVALGEIFGTAVLAFGVGAAVHGNVDKAASGLVVGGSLALGALLFGPLSDGILNPAVAIALDAMSLMYLISPIIGGILGSWLYHLLVD